MEFFEGAMTVRLQSCHGTYLVVDEHWHRVMLRSDRFCDGARWTVVIVTDASGQRRLRLRSFYGRYLAPHPTDDSIFFGRKVMLDDLGPGVNWEPLRENSDVRLRCVFNQFLRADSVNLTWREPVTVDYRSILGIRRRFLWRVEAIGVAPVPLPQSWRPPTQLPPPPPPPAAAACSIAVLKRREETE
ncbi:uncharacterized protein LOC135639124 [Musa acuminata AAA Group]|uniref:uncharacterized protein LOC135639124 n=1 Tax=Musa acuminata AAA Group TaxID=214697 RepID=UPI0031CDB2E2